MAFTPFVSRDGFTLRFSAGGKALKASGAFSPLALFKLNPRFTPDIYLQIRYLFPGFDVGQDIERRLARSLFRLLLISGRRRRNDGALG